MKKRNGMDGFTVTPNHPLRNLNISNAARGLFCTMLSLPKNWNYTVKGLAAICEDGVDAIRTQISELEQQGYLIRSRQRDTGGHFGEMVYELVGAPSGYQLVPSEPRLDAPTMVAPSLDNPTQKNKEEQNTDQVITESSSLPSACCEAKGKEARLREYARYREYIKDNISYELLLQEHPYDTDRVEEILELIIETVCSTKKSIRVAGEDFPADVVRARFLKLDAEHIRFVLDCLSENTTKIRNIKQYLLTTLYNAPATIGNYYSALVQHDMSSGSPR